MSVLKDKQSLFLKNIGLLIAYVNTLEGWQMTEGEGERPVWVAGIYAGVDKRVPEQNGKGIINSLHCDRLAHDFNFYLNGNYITDKETLKPIADYWKSLDPLNAWGGDFVKPYDPFHFSLSYGGRR